MYDLMAYSTLGYVKQPMDAVHSDVCVPRCPLTISSTSTGGDSELQSRAWLYTPWQLYDPRSHTTHFSQPSINRQNSICAPITWSSQAKYGITMKELDENSGPMNHTLVSLGCRALGRTGSLGLCIVMPLHSCKKRNSMMYFCTYQARRVQSLWCGESVWWTAERREREARLENRLLHSSAVRHIIHVVKPFAGRDLNIT